MKKHLLEFWQRLLITLNMFRKPKPNPNSFLNTPIGTQSCQETTVDFNGWAQAIHMRHKEGVKKA